MDKIVIIHGDVTLYEAKEIPATAKRVEWKSGFVLEHGESGHTHTIESECEIYEDNGSMFLKVSQPIQISRVLASQCFNIRSASILRIISR